MLRSMRPSRAPREHLILGQVRRSLRPDTGVAAMVRRLVPRTLAGRMAGAVALEFVLLAGVPGDDAGARPHR